MKGGGGVTLSARGGMRERGVENKWKERGRERERERREEQGRPKSLGRERER